MSRRGFTNCTSSKDADNLVDILHRIGTTTTPRIPT